MPGSWSIPVKTTLSTTPGIGATNLFARDAVLAGMGIRNGITELFNFHLNHTPAYGAAIAQDGHIKINDDLFANGHQQQWQIKVTYVDKGSSSWWVEYSDGQNVVSSDPVSRNDSDRVKTASIDLPAARFNNQLGNAADFRIFNGGTEDLEVRFVRLIKNRRPVVAHIFEDGFENP